MTVLPMMTAPAFAEIGDDVGVLLGDPIGPALRAAGRGQSGDVDDVFDADRNPMQAARDRFRP